MNINGEKSEYLRRMAMMGGLQSALTARLEPHIYAGMMTAGCVGLSNEDGVLCLCGAFSLALVNQMASTFEMDPAALTEFNRTSGEKIARTIADCIKLACETTEEEADG